MRVCVFGLWHLGCVTAACLARGGHDVAGLDRDGSLIERLSRSELPLFEPGLPALVAEGLASGRLRFESDPAPALEGADVLWVTFDTPIDEEDVPQIGAVLEAVSTLIPALPVGCLILISSQLPVGTTRQLAGTAARLERHDLTFGYSPENLRLGKAIEVFSKPDRVVVGLQSAGDKKRVSELLGPFTDKVVWMGLESAEMTKHAINAFLATSVVFMNEIAAICEGVGADAREVEVGLKTEQRIGPGAYLSPGGPFAGGTLARDVTTLRNIGVGAGVPLHLVPAVRDGNNAHRLWALRKLEERLGSFTGRRIAILGLTYKPGTSTLRRSSAVELATELHGLGARVSAFDPAVQRSDLNPNGGIELAQTAEQALTKADAAVIATPWPQFRDLPWPDLLALMSGRVVVDANWHLAAVLRDRGDVAYAAVGLPWPKTDRA